MKKLINICLLIGLSVSFVNAKQTTKQLNEEEYREHQRLVIQAIYDKKGKDFIDLYNKSNTYSKCLALKDGLNSVGFLKKESFLGVHTKLRPSEINATIRECMQEAKK